MTKAIFYGILFCYETIRYNKELRNEPSRSRPRTPHREEHEDQEVSGLLEKRRNRGVYRLNGTAPNRFSRDHTCPDFPHSYLGWRTRRLRLRSGRIPPPVSSLGGGTKKEQEMALPSSRSVHPENFSASVWSDRNRSIQTIRKRNPGRHHVSRDVSPHLYHDVPVLRTGSDRGDNKHTAYRKILSERSTASARIKRCQIQIRRLNSASHGAIHMAPSFFF